MPLPLGSLCAYLLNVHTVLACKVCFDQFALIARICNYYVHVVQILSPAIS